ncbi:MAG: hypothetical protein ACUVXI_18675 [bacterium]
MRSTACFIIFFMSFNILALDIIRAQSNVEEYERQKLETGANMVGGFFMVNQLGGDMRVYQKRGGEPIDFEELVEIVNASRSQKAKSELATYQTISAIYNIVKWFPLAGMSAGMYLGSRAGWENAKRDEDRFGGAAGGFFIWGGLGLLSGLVVYWAVYPLTDQGLKSFRRIDVEYNEQLRRELNVE